MDWVERLFGVSPDGGDGTSEAAVVFACIIILGAVIATRVPALRERIRGSLDVWRRR
jgi:hypothetical protein